MHILAAVVLWGELVAGPHAAGFRTIDAQSASGTYPPKTRAIEIALWHPAAFERQFPIVIWGAGSGTTAARSQLSEYLATHGYVVAFARPKEEREKPASAEGTPAEKLDAEADDLRGALRAVRELPFVDGGRTAVVTWSDGSGPAVRIQQADARVRVVIGLDGNVRRTAALESAPLVPYVELAKGTEKLGLEVRRILEAHLSLDRRALSPSPLELQTDDSTVTAEVYRAAKPRGCIALFHQSGSSRGEHRLAGPLLAADGFTAISADLRWGRRDHWHDVWNETARSTGAIETVDRGEREKFESIRQGAKRDALAAIRWLRGNCEGPLIVWGSSIHANAALDLAVGEKLVDAAIALSPGEYSNAIPDLMRKRVAELRKPVLVVWGRDEEEVSLPVFAAIPAGKKTSFTSAGRHGIATLHEDPRAWAAVREWLRRMVE